MKTPQKHKISKIKKPNLALTSVDVDLGAFFFDLCSLVDSPMSLKTWLLYREGEFEQLVSCKALPEHYHSSSPDSFGLDHLCASIFSKFEDFDLGLDLDRLSFEKWLKSESSCSEVNSLFRERWDGKQAFRPDVEAVISMARRKITRILKDFPHDNFLENCHFGPGMDTSSRRSSRTSAYDKYSFTGDVTPACSSFLSDYLSREESDRRDELLEQSQIVRSSRLSFVPKNAKSKRSICIEPRWNMFSQLGIGKIMASRLRRFGIDLDIRDQTVNQSLAKRAWADGLATIDLSAASDSVATNLVIDLLSDADESWIDAILATRCSHTMYEDKEIRLEKISSMGNGYTFPLETLIFFAITWSVVELNFPTSSRRKDMGVYGDDLIVPAEAVPLLTEVLSCLGFSVNAEKSFVKGDFYESCGADFFKGKPVRPFFIRKRVRTLPQAYALANQIAAYSKQHIDFLDFADREIWNLRQRIIRRIPKHLRCFGPPEAGDGVLHSSFDVARPSRAKLGWEGFWVKCIQTRVVPFWGRRYRGLLFSKLHGETMNGNNISQRGVTHSRLGSVYVPTYTDALLI